VFPDGWIRPFLERALEELPDLELVDAHTHIGENDPDGFRCTPEDLRESLERLPGRAVVFPMHEPDGYAAANDRVIAEAERSGGILTAFCRLDPHDSALAEAERCLDAGAAGIKLHPRAEQFELAIPALREVFALADERRLPVLVHAGRGIPALGRHAVEVCDAFPGVRLILAHAGVCDLAWIWQAAAERSNLFFDTAWWSPSDLLALMALVPPGQVLFGSDAPYGTPTFGAAGALRYALQAGLSGDQVRSLAGGQIARIVGGEEPLDLGPPVGTESLSHDALLDRAYVFLISAIGQMFNGVDPEETLALAALACEVGGEAPQADTCRAILGLLDLRRRLADEAAAAAPGEPEESASRAGTIVPGIGMVVAAAGLARTPAVPLPVEAVRLASTASGRRT
jgi:hypothetical protein